MALIQMNLFAQTLKRTVPVNVILPIDKMVIPGKQVREDKLYKTLYLLHGMFGNYTDWVSSTRIQRYAEKNDLVIVMPSGDNAFYVDQPKGNNFYGEFIGRELVELTRKIFPLSAKREDTFIGGLSMGGYGAMRNGLKYHQTFGNIISLSGALLIDEIPNPTNDRISSIHNRDYAESCFGDLGQLPTSDMNPKYLIQTLKEEGVKLPNIYMACGDQDFLLDMNKRFASFLEEKQVDITFEIGPGDHDWDFWDTYIQKGIEWLPTKKSN